MMQRSAESERRRREGRRWTGKRRERKKAMTIRLNDDNERFRADVAKLEVDNERLKLLVNNADDEHHDQCHELDKRADRIRELEESARSRDALITELEEEAASDERQLKKLRAHVRELEAERDAIKAKTIEKCSATVECFYNVKRYDLADSGV